MSAAFRLLYSLSFSLAFYENVSNTVVGATTSFDRWALVVTRCSTCFFFFVLVGFMFVLFYACSSFVSRNLRMYKCFFLSSCKCLGETILFPTRIGVKEP